MAMRPLACGEKNVVRRIAAVQLRAVQLRAVQLRAVQLRAVQLAEFRHGVADYMMLVAAWFTSAPAYM